MEKTVANTLPDNDAVRTWIEGKMKLHNPEFCKILGWTGDVRNNHIILLLVNSDSIEPGSGSHM